MLCINVRVHAHVCVCVCVCVCARACAVCVQPCKPRNNQLSGCLPAHTGWLSSSRLSRPCQEPGPRRLGQASCFWSWQKVEEFENL